MAIHGSKVNDPFWQHPTLAVHALLGFQVVVISLIFGPLGTPAIYLTKPQMSLTNQQHAHQQHSSQT